MRRQGPQALDRCYQREARGSAGGSVCILAHVLLLLRDLRRATHAASAASAASSLACGGNRTIQGLS